eukprot:Nitzschia sp. Nitz4//scaffold182_size44100//17418//18465//NITZ4_007252-RA/size44100-augustus-gene-0.20-mRNA-1//1//CDS//3329539559//1987//frame0
MEKVDTPLESTNTASDDKNEVSTPPRKTHSTPVWVVVAFVAILAITAFAIPKPLQPHHGESPSIHHVFYYGWLTAVSTGLGALPLSIVPNLPSYYVGVSNAIAAGMMVTASYSLFHEGSVFDDPHDASTIPALYRTIFGAILGLSFINLTEKVLSKHEDLNVGGLDGADAKRALLIFLVMLLHSFSEGVGIGVSFGGAHGSELGVFISASLAVHNIPEGLAMAVTMIPRGTSLLTAMVWAVLSSAPQPLMAVPAYEFVHHFVPILPVGLGFAGGAMAWVAVFELLSEAVEDSGLTTTAIVGTLSLCCMQLLQSAIDMGARSS